jgi:hypothetical protein
VQANRYQYAGQDPVNNTDPSGLTHGHCHRDAGAACGPGTYSREDVPVYFGPDGESWGLTASGSIGDAIGAAAEDVYEAGRGCVSYTPYGLPLAPFTAGDSIVAACVGGAVMSRF